MSFNLKKNKYIIVFEIYLILNKSFIKEKCPASRIGKLEISN